MSVLDIRQTDPSSIDEIRVADTDSYDYSADVIEPYGSSISLKDSNSGRGLRVRDREHAENLIKGLQKAIELGWLK